MRAKTKLTRLCGILLTLALLVGLLPTVALATEPTPTTATADFKNNPTAALDLLNAAKTPGAADSKWEGNTLTLNGVKFTTNNPTAVKLPGGATIVLNGENTIKSTYSDSESDSCGIDGAGSLTIQGTGTLNVTGGAANSSYGIYVPNGNVTINGGTVKATSGTAQYESFGIYARYNVTINGSAKVTATGDAETYNSYGIHAGENVTIQNDAEVTATGGTATYDSCGIHAGDSVTISGGTVTATGDAATYNSYGIFALRYNVTISGTARVTATSGTAANRGSIKKDGEPSDCHTITFHANGGDGIGEMQAFIGSEVTDYTLPANGFTPPVGKQFKGWAIAPTGPVISSTSITVTAQTPDLYAIWEDLYTVTWKSQDGSGTLETDEGVPSGTAPSFNRENPTKDQDDQYTYTFAGWATSKNQERGKDVDSLPNVTDDVTYYAAFSKTARSYPVTLNTNGATSCDALTTYTFGAGATLPTPTKTGYAFGGWYDNSSFTGEAVTVIAADATGAKTFYAKWNAISSGGSYTPPTYKVESTVSKDDDGTVSFSKNSAKKGDTVTITVTPDRYYKVDSVTVKDKNGKEIAVTDNGDGTFTFQMPASKVTVEAVFAWDNPFGDVAEDTYYAPAVEWALKNDVTNGTSDTTFSPNTGCTRAQIVTFLWRAAGCPEPAGMSSFTDVSADAYYAKAVAWAAEQGITEGTGGGKFSPDAVCTRSQSMTFIYRSEQAQGGGMQGEWMFLNPFTDVNLEDYYGEAVMWAVANGVTSGTSDTTFSPNATCTRGQVVTFLYRFFVK